MTADDAAGPAARPRAVEICVRGELSDALVRELGATRRPRTTTIIVPTVDQAALHGVMRRLEDFGLELVSVQHWPGEERRSIDEQPQPRPDDQQAH